MRAQRRNGMLGVVEGNTTAPVPQVQKTRFCQCQCAIPAPQGMVSARYQIGHLGKLRKNTGAHHVNAFET
jgi:hypothetical protein